MRRLLLLLLTLRLASCTAATYGQEALPATAADPAGAAAPAIAPRPTNKVYRLLFDGRATDLGVEVVSVLPDSPLLRMESADDPNLLGIVDAGDVIVSVNGQSIASLTGYYDAMKAVTAGNETVALEIRDVSTGVQANWRVHAVAVDVPADPADDKRKAHFLLVGLTADRMIGKAMDETLAIWNEEAVASIDPDRVGTVLVLKDAECRSGRILRAVRDLPMASRDTLFCVYCGHGAFDPEHAGGDASGGHFFNIPQGDLMRRRLSDALFGRNARLTVLISDTCNARGRALPDVDMVYEQRPVVAMGFSSFEELLFDHRGVVDISATDFGQFGYCQRGTGAWFTAVGAPMLVQQTDWRAGFERIRFAVDNDFQQQRVKYGIEQPHLTPVAFRLDVYRDEADTGVMSMAAPPKREIIYKVRRPAR